ncbi:MAG: hypothetical protein JO282_12870 [Alphaproteobacteria bacterium]|nr:hypothetical protein [Alphaproteobacteria bacterium]
MAPRVMVTVEASDLIGSPEKPLTDARLETRLSAVLMTANGAQAASDTRQGKVGFLPRAIRGAFGTNRLIYRL